MVDREGGSECVRSRHISVSSITLGRVLITLGCRVYASRVCVWGGEGTKHSLYNISDFSYNPWFLYKLAKLLIDFKVSP